jgi:predicted membrane-bound mannosyltransferase
MPAVAVAGHGEAKGKGKGQEKAAQKKAAKGKKAPKPKHFLFKGVYEGAGVVAVAKGNSAVRKGGYVGQDVTFDMSAAKVHAAESDGIAGLSMGDLKAGDVVTVHARLPRGTKAPVAGVQDAVAPAPIVARKVNVKRAAAEEADEVEETAAPVVPVVPVDPS